jgi:hypothetical protein
MQIKCTSCGATQELAANHQCGYCGSAIEQEKAQENYNTSTTGEVGNLMMMAETAVDATNWEEALQYYNKALEKDIANSDAWLGKGIAIVYTSKIGDIKTKEAIAYWKNAIKHAENADAMGKRVAKEIVFAINSFYPTIQNHFIEFIDLEQSFDDLVFRFNMLELAQRFASEIDKNSIYVFEKGFDLCQAFFVAKESYYSILMEKGNRAVNDYLKNSTSHDPGAQLKANAERSAYWKKASDLSEKCTHFYEAREYYFEKLKILDPENESVLEYLRDLEDDEKEMAEWEKENIKTESKAKSGCFIATAAMGDYDHPVVVDLRLFRDNWLSERKWGINFTNWYYTHGPKAALVIERSVVLKKLTFIFVVKPLQLLTKKLR